MLVAGLGGEDVEEVGERLLILLRDGRFGFGGDRVGLVGAADVAEEGGQLVQRAAEHGVHAEGGGQGVRCGQRPTATIKC